MNFDVDDSRPRVVGLLLLCNKICFVLYKSLQRNTHALPYAHTHTHEKNAQKRASHHAQFATRTSTRSSFPSPRLFPLLRVVLRRIAANRESGPGEAETRVGEQRAQTRVVGFIFPIVQSNALKNQRLERGGESRFVCRPDRAFRGDEVYDRERRRV